MAALFTFQAVNWSFRRWPLAHRCSVLAEVAAEVLAPIDSRDQHSTAFQPPAARATHWTFPFQHLSNGSQMLEALSGHAVFADGHATSFGV